MSDSTFSAIEKRRLDELYSLFINMTIYYCFIDTPLIGVVIIFHHLVYCAGGGEWVTNVL
jgi:hypothetical protein